MKCVKNRSLKQCEQSLVYFVPLRMSLTPRVRKLLKRLSELISPVLDEGGGVAAADL
jgi:hypothetical protein